MTHLSMTEGDAEWGKYVSDSEYAGQEQVVPRLCPVKDRNKMRNDEKR